MNVLPVLVDYVSVNLLTNTIDGPERPTPLYLGPTKTATHLAQSRSVRITLSALKKCVVANLSAKGQLSGAKLSTKRIFSLAKRDVLVAMAGWRPISSPEKEQFHKVSINQSPPPPPLSLSLSHVFLYPCSLFLRNVRQKKRKSTSTSTPQSANSNLGNGGRGGSESREEMIRGRTLAFRSAERTASLSIAKPSAARFAAAASATSSSSAWMISCNSSTSSSSASSSRPRHPARAHAAAAVVTSASGLLHLCLRAGSWTRSFKR